VILFNWKLLQLPVRLADYVIVHELIHLVEPNHGSGFWRALEGAMPDWRERKEALDLRAQEIYWCREAMAQ
jgi:predicted metal-dependent hydrolase